MHCVQQDRYVHHTSLAGSHDELQDLVSGQLRVKQNHQVLYVIAARTQKHATVD